MSPSDDTSAVPAASPQVLSAPRPFAVCREDDPLPPALEGAVAAIGNFDGVHLGHRALIRAVRAQADAAVRARPAVVLTFEPHPRRFFAPDQPMFRLTSPGAKEILFASLGLDGLIVRRFDRDLAATTAHDFVTDFLKARLRLSGVVIGHDFHFGRGREGNPARLSALCDEVGLTCHVIPAVTPRDGAPPVSSSAIRAALGAGEIARASLLLGYRWFVQGVVRHGEKRGRTLGYPTANLQLDSCGLAHGIYAVRARLADGTLRDGVASYGRRPTFDDGAPLLEVNLFDFAGDLYGRPLTVEFVGFIRGEARFDSAESLVARMHVDAALARAILASDRAPSMLEAESRLRKIENDLSR